MKNLRYIPYVRNRYYEGKLLTAADFKQEQTYMNDKRRLHNRYLHGAGVVSGLELVRVDDYCISLEMGVAVDASGREIVVAAPSIYHLSDLEGFEESTRLEGSESLYVYIAYREEEAEPVRNLLDQSLHTVEEPEHNKVKELYHLYLSDEEPEELEEEAGTEKRFTYLSERAERIDKNTYTGGICLARIYLVKAGAFYMIDKIEPMPGGQYALCIPYLAGRVAALEKEVEEQRRQLVECSGKTVGSELGNETHSAKDSQWQTAQGSTRLSIGKKAREGQCFYSGEIGHGLGLGRTDIFLQILHGDELFGGAEDLFREDALPLAVGYRLFRNRGTFVIGIRLLDGMESQEVTINWTAVRSSRHNEFKKEEKKIFIQPSVMNIHVRQDVKLQAVCVNLLPEAISWQVVLPEGGSVDGDGTYHAPSHSGVYEVRAEDREDPKVRASVYVVVREV